ncbi:GntR family transcriptional regulator [Actinokineospora inagensis]|uniref:GntR family transcriptional regulator n=1 Tax=Actinokineospora inagensis TaxID=103730 RepID=UPI000A01FD29|nr:GntR family transcriptional regulator [Actinokineospora inagensis]
MGGNLSAQDEPASKRVAAALRGRIEKGELAAGSKLPSEREIASEYEIARTTASAAIRLLEQEGLVLRQHGRGNFVRETSPLIRLGGDRYSRKYRGGPTPFRRECERAGLTPRVEVLAAEQARPPIEIAQRLGVDSFTESVLQRSNLYFADDEPVQVVNTYIPWAVAEGTPLVERKQTGKDGIYGRLEDCGHIMTTIREEVTARMPDHREREMLALPGGTPVLQVIHTSIDQNQSPFEVTRFVLRADRNGLLYQLAVD